RGSPFGGQQGRPSSKLRDAKQRSNKRTAAVMSLADDTAYVESLSTLSGFRTDLHRCLTRRTDTLFELTEAVLCTDGPITSPAEPTLTAEHQRGHGAMYNALNHGRLDIARLRWSLAGLPLPRAADGRTVLAVDVSPWLRPDAATSPD